MAKAKTKTAFVCNDCGSEYSKWQGQCSDCNAWNSIVEFRIASGGRGGSVRSAAAEVARGGFSGTLAQAEVLKDINLETVPRFGSGMSEFDRVLGGGLVPASAVLVGGDLTLGCRGYRAPRPKVSS